MKDGTIPKAVLKLLLERWVPYEGFSKWESSFRRDNEERQARPSYYIHGPGAGSVYGASGFTYAEMRALTDAGVFDGLVHEQPNGVLSINEHAVHAIEDFLHETYRAWNRFVARRSATFDAVRPELEETE